MYSEKASHCICCFLCAWSSNINTWKQPILGCFVLKSYSHILGWHSPLPLRTRRYKGNLGTAFLLGEKWIRRMKAFLPASVCTCVRGWCLASTLQPGYGRNQLITLQREEVGNHQLYLPSAAELTDLELLATGPLSRYQTCLLFKFLLEGFCYLEPQT